MKDQHLITHAATAGELRLPGGQPRLASFRTLAFYVVATLALALPASALSSILAPSPATTTSISVLDRRTQAQRAIEDAQNRVLRDPSDPRAMAALASAYLLRTRETGDPSYYQKAEELVRRALAARPDDSDALIVTGGLALARHDFIEAFAWGERAVALAPARPAAHAVLVDALVELGRYDEAVAAAQRLVDLRPDLVSLSRVSYLRELHGDLQGAIELMAMAVEAGAPRSEATVWSEVQLGNLLFARGDLDAASRAYADALQRIPAYPYATAGLARVAAARGDLATAARLYDEAATRLPVLDLVVPLADLYERLGDQRAARQRELVGVIRTLFAANGVRVDVDLALYDADRGVDLPRAVAVAREEYARRPSVHVADVLAWAEYRSGDLENALGHSREALRLGWRDPLVLYHAGVIAQASGDRARAHELLRRSSEMNPRFSILWADDLAARLRELSAGGGAR